MSNRERLFELTVQPYRRPGPRFERRSISLFQDNDSGTWRLFLNPSYECVDLSLAQLRKLTAELNTVISAIEADDWNNAEFAKAEYAKMDD